MIRLSQLNKKLKITKSWQIVVRADDKVDLTKINFITETEHPSLPLSQLTPSPDNRHLRWNGKIFSSEKFQKFFFLRREIPRKFFKN